MSKERRQRIVLGVLVAILAAMIWRGLAGSGVGGGGDRAGALQRDSRGRGSAPLTAEKIVQVRVKDLEQKPGQFSPGRDPFRFAPPPQPQQAPAPPPPPPRQAAPPPQPVAPPVPPAPRPPAVDFRYLGSFGPEDRRLAVFSDVKDIYNVFEGGVVKDKFVVKKIGYESADIGFVDFPDAPPQRLAVGGR